MYKFYLPPKCISVLDFSGKIYNTIVHCYVYDQESCLLEVYSLQEQNFAVLPWNFFLSGGTRRGCSDCIINQVLNRSWFDQIFVNSVGVYINSQEV